jgi:hypothetical protein
VAAADFCRRLQGVPFGSRNLLVASWLSRPATLQTLYCELQWTKRTAPRTTIFEPTIELLHPILAERSGSHDQRQLSNMPDRAAPQQKHALHRVCGVPNLAPPRTTVGLGPTRVETMAVDSAVGSPSAGRKGKKKGCGHGENNGRHIFSAPTARLRGRRNGPLSLAVVEHRQGPSPAMSKRGVQCGEKRLRRSFFGKLNAREGQPPFPAWLAGAQ